MLFIVPPCAKFWIFGSVCCALSQNQNFEVACFEVSVLLNYKFFVLVVWVVLLSLLVFGPLLSLGALIVPILISVTTACAKRTGAAARELSGETAPADSRRPCSSLAAALVL